MIRDIIFDNKPVKADTFLYLFRINEKNTQLFFIFEKYLNLKLKYCI